MDSKKLFSVIVICYNNFQYIFETLDSVFIQDYPNIELIISDDASASFDVDKVINYINEKKSSSIQQVIINVNKQNQGTVMHLEQLHKKCSGEYIVSIAADDVWYDSMVISSFANVFETHGDNTEIVTSQVGMYDHELVHKINDFVAERDIELLKRQDAKEIFAELSYRCFIPGLGTAFRKTVFEKIGELSHYYKYVEDWTTHLRAIRSGMKIYYADFISAKHRDGGISHGNTKNSKLVYLKYSQDLLDAYKLEVEPYLNLLNDENRVRARLFYEYRSKRHQQDLEKFNNQVETIPETNESTVKNDMHKKKIRTFTKDLSYRASRLKTIKETFFWCLMLFIASSTMITANSDEMFVYVLGNCFKYSGLFILAVVLGQLCLNLLFKLRRLMWKRRGVL